MAKYLKKTRGVMNLLTKEECTYALNDLKNIIKDILGDESCVDECIKTLQKLIDEHFDNPPLKWEELKEGMLVYDKNIKSWIEIDKTFEDTKQYVSCWSIGWPYEKRFPYEPNRFYRKEVRE